MGIVKNKLYHIDCIDFKYLIMLIDADFNNKNLIFSAILAEFGFKSLKQVVIRAKNIFLKHFSQDI
jgi:hypothetical protein